MKELCGIIVATATPMNADETVDLGASRALAEKLIENGADGLFVCGTMGECPYLSLDEKASVAKAMIEGAAGRVPVVVGTGAPTTQEVIELGKRLADSGADAVSVVLPYYFKPSQEEIYAHFAKILKDSALPVLAYNIPHFTGTHMQAATAAKLWKEHGLLGIKDSSRSFETLSSFVEETGEGFRVIVGADELILPGLKLGACGAISAPSNVLLNVIRTIYASYISGNIAKAEKAQADWDRVTELLSTLGTFPATVKLAMSQLTMPVGNARLPILPADENKLAQILPELKQIESNYAS